MYTINPFPPPFGVCSICQKHDCGVSPESEKWVQIPLELFKGGDIHIGYNCIKSMSDNLQITKEVIEREVLLTPSVEQIGDYVRKAILEKEPRIVPHEPWMTISVEVMGRDDLKAFLKANDIPFTPQWGDDKLRELARQHV